MYPNDIFACVFRRSQSSQSLYFSLSLSHFEGFEADQDDDPLDDVSPHLSPPPTIILSHHTDPVEEYQPSDTPSKPTAQIVWDEDEFEGFPIEQILEKNEPTHETNVSEEQNPEPDFDKDPILGSYYIEAVLVLFVVLFVVNYLLGKREIERIALAWAGRFAAKGSIFEKNFSLLGVEDGKDEDAPLLLKEGTNVFKFYASGRRYCQGMVATMELKSRHDLISRVVSMVIPRRDEITFEMYMNEESMDHVVFALAKKKKAKVMVEESDLVRFGGLLAAAAGGKKWVAEELEVVAESKEVAEDLITEAVLEQVFGDEAYEKYGKGFISMHFSDQHVGRHRKALVFKFSLPNAKSMADMTRLVALVPYYIDLIGRYKLKAHAKTEAAQQKVAQEIYSEFQNARHEVLQKKKAEHRKLVEEAEEKLSAEAIRKKEFKERARQVKKAMPKVMTSCGN